MENMWLGTTVQAITDFYSHPFFIIFGGITATIIVIGFVLNIILWALGIGPLLWRLGLGRWMRKITIVADAEHYSQLKKVLVDSGVFREGNISQINNQSIAEVKDRGLLLVHYQSFTSDQIKEILANKKSQAGMVFYFPQTDGTRIPDDIFKQITEKENTTIVNLRGRLLNDVVTTLITTSYD